MSVNRSITVGSTKTLLTPRQNQVLGFLALGYSYKQIAAELHLSLETVRQHIKDIYRRLNVNSGTQAIVRFLNG